MLELSFKLTTKVAMWQERGQNQGKVRKVNHTLNPNGKLSRGEGKHDPMTLAI